MADQPDDVRVPLGERLGDAGRGVARAVVDGDDLERLGQARQGGQRLLDQALEVGFLVVRREEVGEPRDAVGRSERRSRSGVPARHDDAGQVAGVDAIDRLELVARGEQGDSRSGPTGSRRPGGRQGLHRSRR